MRMMLKRTVAAVLGGALTLGSFLCLGMGMDMGTSWAPEQSHDCCPSQKAELPSDSNCCLLLPGALSAPVILPVPVQSSFAVASTPAVRVVSVELLSVPVHGPPGDSSPGFTAPSSPRAPPVA